MLEQNFMPVDLGSPDLRAFGRGRDVITVELSTDFGQLYAEAWRRVEVDILPDGTLSLTGRRGDVQRFLKKSGQVQITDADGETPPSLEMTVKKDGEVVTLADLTGAPTEVSVDPGEETRVDFSNLRLGRLAQRNEEITVEVTASAGDLSATATEKVSVVEIDGGLALSGTRRDIQRFLKRGEGIVLEGDGSDEGTTTADIGVSVVKDGEALDLQDIAGVPTVAALDDDVLNGLDLSSLKLKHFAARNEYLTVELEVEDGILNADGTSRVRVDTISDTKIQLTGKRGDLQRFINDIANVTHTGSDQTLDAGGAFVTVTIINPEEELSLSDPDDVILSVINNGIRINLGAAAGLSDDILAIEETETTIDLSDLSLRFIARGRDELTLEIKVTDGTLSAIADDRVVVDDSDPSVLRLTGQRRNIERYLDNVEAVTFMGNEDVFGTDAAVLSLAAVTATNTLALGSIGVDIEDTADSETGTNGNDTITGDAGMNTLIGLAGDDYIQGLEGNDSIDAGDDDDVRGGDGADTLDGGAGNDVLLYTYSNAGVTVDLTVDGSGFQQASGGFAEGDVISNFEHVYASNFADNITGNDDRNILFGYDGDDIILGHGDDDVIRGGAGADTMDGGEGADWLRYVTSVDGVSINLTTGEDGFQDAAGGDAEGDVISNFENVQGSEFGDVLIGGDDANYLIGNGGDDEIDGGAGRDIIRGGLGSDTLEGGADADTLLYTGGSVGVTVSLEADENGFQSAAGGEAEGDVISGFENVYASNGNDGLTGDDNRNILYGYSGEDTLDGGLGADVLRGGAGADDFVFRTELGDGNVDRIIDFEAGLDSLILDSLIFSGLAAGGLSAQNFHVSEGGLAESFDHFIIYDQTTGSLSYDADGSGEAAEGIEFATLSTTPIIDETDFFIL
ncbi:MAG: calcium-binding protein [Rhodobacteraceae bacterium]|nr:calcium-binding protein [Paracoccaceae bacterium]